jgi:hypothetical protein
MRDDFVFADEEESYETSDSYGPGGFFPVRLGDTVSFAQTWVRPGDTV